MIWGVFWIMICLIWITLQHEPPISHVSNVPLKKLKVDHEAVGRCFFLCCKVDSSGTQSPLKWTLTGTAPHQLLQKCCICVHDYTWTIWGFHGVIWFFPKQTKSLSTHMIFTPLSNIKLTPNNTCFLKWSLHITKKFSLSHLALLEIGRASCRERV